MKKDDYIKKTKGILSCFNENKNNDEEYNDIMREFKHIVYSYDSSLPLLKELDNLNPIITLPFDGEVEEIKQCRKYIEFFIHYLEEYDNN